MVTLTSCISAFKGISMTKIRITSHEDEEGMITGVVRDVPPTHYTFKVESFSVLSNSSIEKYESCDFEAGGYKWKLLMYPKGNKNGKGYVSLYLEIADMGSLLPGWEVNVIFRFFLFDQIGDKYLTFTDNEGIVRRFHAMKTQWGISQLIPLSTLEEPSNGYLVDDACVFGAEVFVCKSNGKGESLAMIEDAFVHKHTWKIEKFSQITEDLVTSDVFFAGDQQWCIYLRPKGSEDVENIYFSVYLDLVDSETISPVEKVFAEFKLRLKDQISDKHLEIIETHWFIGANDSWGYPGFIKFENFNDITKGYLVNDVCILEAEVTVRGLVTKFP
ncbi:hypothetical protein GIB67_011856 [Kingdonia uniflora]|uniref:MATH domain-containing protein n=1 Tax=Kingdonia uniflora TaxID=39325 RepID=A0A7J7LND0_9MAGN|nr:hypothetical protein GIB67_011856 [Kingdonia uniflora]